MRDDYLESLSEFRSHYKEECTKANIDYVGIDTSVTFDKALLEYLIQRQRRFEGQLRPGIKYHYGELESQRRLTENAPECLPQLSQRPAQSQRVSARRQPAARRPRLAGIAPEPRSRHAGKSCQGTFIRQGEGVYRP